MTKLERAKKLARALELTADSLTSHLEYAHKPFKACDVPSHRSEHGSKKFHRQCVREYAEIALTLAEELEKL